MKILPETLRKVFPFSYRENEDIRQKHSKSHAPKNGEDDWDWLLNASSLYSNIVIAPNKPDIPYPSLEPGWQWIATSWLFYWMVKDNPINKASCIFAEAPFPIENSLDVKTSCMSCLSARPYRGDAIAESVLSFLDAIESPALETDVKRNIELLERSWIGFERVRESAKSVRENTLVSMNALMSFRRNSNIPPPPTSISLVEVLSLFLGYTRIRIGVFANDARVGIGNGRHRTCAAYRFGVPELPVFVSM